MLLHNGGIHGILRHFRQVTLQGGQVLGVRLGLQVVVLDVGADGEAVGKVPEASLVDVGELDVVGVHVIVCVARRRAVAERKRRVDAALVAYRAPARQREAVHGAARLGLGVGRVARARLPAQPGDHGSAAAG